MSRPFIFAASHMSRVAATALAASLLAGCVKVGIGSEPPPSLLTLTSEASVAAGTQVSAADGTVISLVEFAAPQKLNVTRVPVQVTQSEIAYLQNAVWVERPARLLRRLIAETLRSQGGRVVLDGDTPAFGDGVQISGTLREFGYDAGSSSVIVQFDAVRTGAGDASQTQRFEARVSGVPAEAAPVGAALNEAANDIAGQIAEWMQ
jgi:cholesterol transport system auxiliary component